MMIYYTTTTPSGNTIYFYEANGYKICFGECPANTDYQQYLKWLAEGNTPEPAEGAE